jgi:hypothetical protein
MLGRDKDSHGSVFIQTTNEKRNSAQLKKCPTSMDMSALARDVFVDALAAIPADDWCKSWPAERTIMLRMTSKKVKEAVDKLCPPVVVCLSKKFYKDTVNFTSSQIVLHILTQFSTLPSLCRITTANLSGCKIKGKDAHRLAEVLQQCPALHHLDLADNDLGAVGAGSLAGVLSQCPAISHLNVAKNGIGAEGVEILAGVLGRCLALSHLNISRNNIGDYGVGVLAAVLVQCQKLSHLNLGSNRIGAEGAGRLAGVLVLCPSMQDLDLGGNTIQAEGVGRIAGVLVQCPALTHLNLGGNNIGAAGAWRLSSVLAQCQILSHLDLRYQWLGAEGSERLRPAWRGLPSALLLD